MSSPSSNFSWLASAVARYRRKPSDCASAAVPSAVRAGAALDIAKTASPMIPIAMGISRLPRTSASTWNARKPRIPATTIERDPRRLPRRAHRLRVGAEPALGGDVVVEAVLHLGHRRRERGPQRPRAVTDVRPGEDLEEQRVLERQQRAVAVLQLHQGPVLGLLVRVGPRHLLDAQPPPHGQVDEGRGDVDRVGLLVDERAHLARHHAGRRLELHRHRAALVPEPGVAGLPVRGPQTGRQTEVGLVAAGPADASDREDRRRPRGRPARRCRAARRAAPGRAGRAWRRGSARRPGTSRPASR